MPTFYEQPIRKTFCEQATQTSYNNSKQNELSKRSSSSLASKSMNKSMNKSTSKSISKSSENLLRRSLINSSIKKSTAKKLPSIANDLHAQSKLKDVSNITTNQKSKQAEKAKKSKLYDKSNWISFSTAHVYEPETSKKNSQTVLIESLLEDSSFKNLNLDSLVSKKSNQDSTNGKTKNYTGSFTGPTKSTHQLAIGSNSLKETNLIPLNSSELDDELNNKTTSSKSKVQTKQSEIKIMRNSIKANESELKKSILKKSISENEDLNEAIQSEVSLILNSTHDEENNKSIELNSKSEETSNQVTLKELDKNLDVNDLSAISFESDIDIVFDEEENSLSKFNEEIELIRKSTTHSSAPELSVGSTSISETVLSQSTNKFNDKPKEQQQQPDLSVEFNSDGEKEDEDKKLEEATNKKLTPKSILKNSSSKRIWDASDYSFVDLTISSSYRNQKNNSVRFSDKVSEKFASNLLMSSRKESVQNSKGTLIYQSIDRSPGKEVGKSISKSIDDLINQSIEKETSKRSDRNDRIDDDNLEDGESTTGKLSAENSNDLPDLNESEVENLNVTVDDINESLNDDQTTSANGEATRNTTFIVQSTIKKPAKKAIKKKNFINNKKTPKYYETFVNNTPTIIYPNIDKQESNDLSTVRRSNRIRVRPLDWWRLQKPKYKFDRETKCLMIDGVEKGFNSDNPFKKQRKVSDLNQAKRQMKKKKSKKIKYSHFEKADDEDIEKQEEEEVIVKKKRYSPNEISIHQQLNKTAIELSDKIKREASEFCSQNELKWTESKQSKGVRIAFISKRKSSSGETQASGFMKLDSLLKKPIQRSANYVTKYVVMFGATSVIIGRCSNNDRLFIKIKI